MEFKEFESLFVKQFFETDSEEIGPNTKYKELDEWSSLVGMSLICEVKENFGKIISSEDIKKCETVKDLYDLMISK